MKLQVIVKNASKNVVTNTVVDAIAGPTDTVLNVQEYAASIANIASFPDQKLFLKGKALQNTDRLTDHDIKDGDTLELQFQASEQTLVDQISGLLGDKALSPEEISLLYSYRYGISFEDALTALGLCEGRIRPFLESQKRFSFHNDVVKVAVAAKSLEDPEPTKDCLPSVIQVTVSVDIKGMGKPLQLLSDESTDDEDKDVCVHLEMTQSVARAKEIIAGLVQMPFPDRDLMLGGNKLEDGMSLYEAGVKDGSKIAMVVRASEEALASQLEDLLKEKTALAPGDLGLHYCQRYGTPVSQALRTLGLHANLRRFLESHSNFCLIDGSVSLVNKPLLMTSVLED